MGANFYDRDLSLNGMNEKDPKFFIAVTVIVIVALFIAVQFVLPENFYAINIMSRIGSSF